MANGAKNGHAISLPDSSVLGTTIHEFAEAARCCAMKLVDGPPTNVGLRRRTKSDHDDVMVERRETVLLDAPASAPKLTPKFPTRE
jgi:hypothetical protein